MIETQQGLTRQSKASDKRETEITKKTHSSKTIQGHKEHFFKFRILSSASYWEFKIQLLSKSFK